MAGQTTLQSWLPALLLLCGLITLQPALAAPAAGPGPAVGTVTKLPLPRFVTLRTDEVNLRAGPGFQYPVSWIYQRDGLPVEIIGEFDVWRQILAPDGGTGWVHMATLRGRRGFFVTAAQTALRAGPNRDARAVALLNQGVSGLLLSCDGGDWCKAAAGPITGYLARADFWGAFAGEVLK